MRQRSFQEPPQAPKDQDLKAKVARSSMPFSDDAAERQENVKVASEGEGSKRRIERQAKVMAGSEEINLDNLILSLTK